MGDTKEFTTKANSELVFHKINSGGITFSIKGASNALVGLSEVPDPSNAYWISIGVRGQSWIRRQQENLENAVTPDIINRNTFRNFWLGWNRENIRFGCKNDPSPILSTDITEKRLTYVTFATNIHEPDSIQWKVMLPPDMGKPKITPLKGGEPRWEPVKDKIPDDALVGGYENETLYIIRTKHRGSLTPGKFVPSKGIGYISWGGEEHIVKENFEILCGYNCVWVKTYADNIPVGAVEGGYSEDHPRTVLYVGRAECDGHIIPGKVQPSYRVCFVPFNGQEVSRPTYEILVVPHANTRSACATYYTNFEIDVQEPVQDDSE